MIGSALMRMTMTLLVCASCHISKPVTIEAKDVPGTYVFDGHESRDELVLKPDGTFARTAVYRGVRQTQSGQWSFDGVFSGFAYVTFAAQIPECLRSTQPANAFFRWKEPNDALCGSGTFGVYFCLDRGRPALCFSEDEGFNFRKAD